MRASSVLSLFAFVVAAHAHATFQQFWVNGVDKAGTCVRKPQSNSPVTSATSSDITCNAGGTTPASGTCAVAAGDKITVEMHQQAGDRSCSNEAIGGNHDGPVIVYMAKTSDVATTSPQSLGWFKIGQTGLVSKDYWGTDVMNANCGKIEFTVPKDIAPGNYLLRAEVVALHVAGSVGGAQFYVSCYQLSVSGSGSASPSTVKFPGAYSATDPGILFNLYGSYTSYTVPGPAVYGGGAAPAPTTAATANPTTAAPVTTAPPTNTGTPVAEYGQCGGTNYSGSTNCVSGTTCKKVNDYYYQCNK
jgi:cellulase